MSVGKPLESTTAKKYLIGIDPGRNTGICVYSQTDNKIVELSTFTNFWYLVKYFDGIGNMYPLGIQFKFILEDPQLNDPVFISGRHGLSTRQMLKVAQDVGRNKEQAYLLIEYMKIQTRNFITVQPTQSKWKPEYFQRLTGWEGKSNEHTRDAARLVWGR